MRTHIRARYRRALRRGVAASLSAAFMVCAAAAAAIAASPAASPAPQLRVNASHHVLAGRRASVNGSGDARLAGHRLVVEARSRSGWRAVAQARAGAGGRFSASWRPRIPGSYPLRVRVDLAAAAIGPLRAGKLIVYRPVLASFYGPGLYGGALACGGRLAPATLGVANKTLPCGTHVTLRYHNRSVTVPVVDRGPYAAGRTYDLTAATRARLSFPSTGVVWSSR